MYKQTKRIYFFVQNGCSPCEKRRLSVRNRYPGSFVHLRHFCKICYEIFICFPIFRNGQPDTLCAPPPEVVLRPGRRGPLVPAISGLNVRPGQIWETPGLSGDWTIIKIRVLRKAR